MVWFALSFQDQVEKYGAYVGIAAFFGLAVLSLLYFSQARELKRLREWAGRSPERAQELEERVVAQAAAGAALRGPGATGAIVPPRRLAEMPPTAAAPAAAAVGQATELAEAVPDAPATNGSVPPPPRGPGGSVAAGPAPPLAVNGAAPADAAPPADEPAPEEEPAAEEAGAAAPEEPAAEEAGAAAPEEAAPDDAVVASPPATAIPRKTPAQRVGVSPRPAALPLRTPAPSAVPPSQRGGARRPPGPAPAAPAPGRRSAGTIALLVGLAVLLLGGGTFLASQLLGSDDAPAPPNQAAPPPAQDGGAAARQPPAQTNVAVLNGTTFTGLAGQIADRVSQEGGYERGVTETNTRDQTLQASTVYFADGFRGSARSVARMLSIGDVQPLDEETAALAPGADVVVLAGADQAP